MKQWYNKYFCVKPLRIINSISVHLFISVGMMLFSGVRHFFSDAAAMLRWNNVSLRVCHWNNSFVTKFNCYLLIIPSYLKCLSTVEQPTVIKVLINNSILIVGGMIKLVKNFSTVISLLHFIIFCSKTFYCKWSSFIT